VAVNRAISSDNARASALLRRLSASRFNGRIRSLARAVFTVSATATAWAPTMAAWSISSSSRWLVASEIRLNDRLRVMSWP
jgi:hypothetical protein